MPSWSRSRTRLEAGSCCQAIRATSVPWLVTPGTRSGSSRSRALDDPQALEAVLARPDQVREQIGVARRMARGRFEPVGSASDDVAPSWMSNLGGSVAGYA